jgi:exopolysaccharide production protein ExoY
MRGSLGTFQSQSAAEDFNEIGAFSDFEGQASCTKSALDSWHYRYSKRSIDIVCSLMMVITFTLPGLLIAAAIRLSSRGPVFFREERIGRGGRVFRIWKFRTMYVNSPQVDCIASAKHGEPRLEFRMSKHIRDPRVTASGGFLRRWSLDELPQLFNVLSGEMSLIGPRPIVKSETDFYGDLLEFYLEATPGISGLWQVSGRSNLGYQERAELDAIYVRNWNRKVDEKVFWRTIPAVLGRIGAR